METSNAGSEVGRWKRQMLEARLEAQDGQWKSQLNAMCYRNSEFRTRYHKCYSAKVVVQKQNCVCQKCKSGNTLMEIDCALTKCRM